MMACENDFTVHEKKAILELRRKLENEEENKCDTLYDDLIVYKFLKGCDFKLRHAEQMLKKHIKWRKVYQVDRILQDYKPVEVLELYLSQSFLGYGKEGHPIRYSAAGNVDIDGIFKSATFLDFLKCIVHLVESDIVKTKEQSEKLQKPISQFIYIYNLENLTIAKALNKKNLHFFMLGASLFQENYPERLKNVFVINAPSFFTLPFSILKTVISSGLLKKVKVYGQYGWREALLEVIDENVLPAFLGGKRTDPDGNPLCLSFVNHCSPVPEKYFLFNDKEDFRNSKGVQKLTIRNKTKIEIDVIVEESGLFIEWFFEVKSRDIGFGISFETEEEDKSKTIELIPIHRTETPDVPENGILYCEKPGKYIIIFDNSYSFLTSKEVFCKIIVNSKK